MPLIDAEWPLPHAAMLATAASDPNNLMNVVNLSPTHAKLVAEAAI
jgi:hypothetical protein